MSDQSITRQQVGRVRLAKTTSRPPLILLGPALVDNSLCRGQGQRITMNETEVQIGNFELRPLKALAIRAVPFAVLHHPKV